ncbi:MAG: hypothetical protein KC416_01845 [Myxococcales bacterium]|nr:hypothetical protein [Myxococcales bacterium]
MEPDQLLHQVLTADRTLRQAEAAFLAVGPSKVVPLLAQRVGAVASQQGDEIVAELCRLATLCLAVGAEGVAPILIQILDHDSPQARATAGAALLEVGYDRYAEVAQAIEQRLQGPDGYALEELPTIIVEIAEPSARKLLRGFLARDNANIVATAMEAFAALGEPEAIAYLEPFTQDPRTVSIEDLDVETATLGELAAACIDELSE